MHEDSFQVIAAFLARYSAWTNDLVRAELSDALADVYHRLRRVRQVAPTVDYSERMWMLLEAAGYPNESLRKSHS